MESAKKFQTKEQLLHRLQEGISFGKFIHFREAGISEVVDFKVLKNFQRQGIGTALMIEAELYIARVSERARNCIWSNV